MRLKYRVVFSSGREAEGENATALQDAQTIEKEIYRYLRTFPSFLPLLER
jgi:hypothetical protein